MENYLKINYTEELEKKSWRFGGQERGKCLRQKHAEGNRP